MRRELQLALLLVLAGAALLLFGAGRAWVDLALPQAPPLPSRSEVRTGSELIKALSPLGLVGLAGVAALAATRGRGRVLVGVVLTAAGASAAAATVSTVAGGAGHALGISTDSHLGFTGWPWVALTGGVLLALGGLVVALRGQRWAALSARYEAPAARAQTRPARPEVEAWEALDRGEDPTTDDPGPGAEALQP